MSKGPYTRHSHWAGYVAELFYRGTTVTTADAPGIWKVYGPAGEAGHYWLEPAEKIAEAIALTMPYGMVESRDSAIERYTQQKE
jgi:hypothetical protein